MQRERVEVTQAEFRAMVDSLKSPLAISLDKEHIMEKKDMLAKDRETGAVNPYRTAGLVKRGTVSGIINASYESCVNRQNIREDNSTDPQAFSSDPLPFGEWVGHVVVHKGVVYLPIKPQASHTTYWLNGVEVPYDALRNFLPLPSTSQKQADLGIAKEVKWNMIRLDRIVKVRMEAGKEYVLVEEHTDPEKVRKTTETVEA